MIRKRERRGKVVGWKSTLVGRRDLNSDSMMSRLYVVHILYRVSHAQEKSKSYQIRIADTSEVFARAHLDLQPGNLWRLGW